MSILQNLRKRFIKPLPIMEKGAAEAYDLWSATYDRQPDNLMLRLDEEMFGMLLDRVALRGRTVLDIGCGTGRHWPLLMKGGAARLIGYDVSEGMLIQLRKKFPQAETHLALDPSLFELADESIGVLVSTLTMAHLPSLDASFAAWARVLKKGASVLITDFHPAVLARGGQRDFTTSSGRRILIVNYVHSVEDVLETAAGYGFEEVRLKERRIDESLRPVYLEQKALHVYERFKGLPIIYGLHLVKQ